MFTTSTALTRDDAEATLVDDWPLTVALLTAITSASPDVAFSSGCCPDDCDPERADYGCLMVRTKEMRLADWALEGWGQWQQVDGPTRFHAHDWSSGPARLVEPIDNGGGLSVHDARFSIQTDVIGYEHVVRFEQRFWLMANLVVVATATERHPVRVHTITPSTPRHPWHS